MKTYEIQFTGRRVRAIGKFHPIRAMRFGVDAKAAIAALYDEFEHISQPEAKEVPSPFGVETLFNLARNEQRTAESFAHWCNMMVSEMARLARRAAKANAEWADDPEDAAHGLYHAETEMQFPPEVQIEAAAEMALYYLRERPAGLNICDRLQLAENKEGAK